MAANATHDLHVMHHNNNNMYCPQCPNALLLQLHTHAARTYKLCHCKNRTKGHNCCKWPFRIRSHSIALLSYTELVILLRQLCQTDKNEIERCSSFRFCNTIKWTSKRTNERANERKLSSAIKCCAVHSKRPKLIRFFVVVALVSFRWSPHWRCCVVSDKHMCSYRSQ